MSTTKTKPTAGTRSKTYTFWVTRDSDPETGIAYQKVRVWVEQPKRHGLGAGAFWLGPALEGNLFCEWSLADCLYHVKTYPDDDRQCIKVEGDRVWQPGDQLNKPEPS